MVEPSDSPDNDGAAADPTADPTAGAPADDTSGPPSLVPVPESQEAFDWLGSFGDPGTEKSVRRMAGRVRESVPECVALSVTLGAGDLTFTLMVDRPGAALLDAMQYLDGGPCLHAVDARELTVTSDLPTDEGRWQMFARAEGVVGISSTLSLPVMDDGQLVGGVNLYASTNDAFKGRHQELAELCGAWAAGAITNADLGFTSRVRAATAPERLKSRSDVDVAAGVVAEHQNIGIEEARSRISRAATRASVAEPEFARFIVGAHTRDVA